LRRISPSLRDLFVPNAPRFSICEAAPNYSRINQTLASNRRQNREAEVGPSATEAARTWAEAIGGGGEHAAAAAGGGRGREVSRGERAEVGGRENREDGERDYLWNIYLLLAGVDL
jgi:hypothetical protein